MKVKFFALLSLVLLAALPLSAQTNPTGIISGKVVDPDRVHPPPDPPGEGSRFVAMEVEAARGLEITE